MGSLTFTECFHLLLTGREPTEDQRYFLDLLPGLDRRARDDADERGRTDDARRRPGVACRVRSRPGSWAAGLSSLGTAEPCARCSREMQARVVAGAGPEVVAAETAQAIHAAREKAPGFGHPGPPARRPAPPADPRAGGRAVRQRRARLFRTPLARCGRRGAGGRPLTMRRRVAADRGGAARPRGFATSMVKSIPLLARTAGLLAHLADGQRLLSGFVPQGCGGGCRVRARGRMMVAPEVESRYVGGAARSSTTAPTASSLPTCSSARASYRRSSPTFARPTPPADSPIARLPLD